MKQQETEHISVNFNLIFISLEKLIIEQINDEIYHFLTVW